MKLAKILLLSGAAAIGFTNAGKCPFGFDDKDVGGSPMGRVLQAVVVPVDSAKYPSDVLKCTKANKTLTTNNTTFTTDDYETIAGDVMDQYENATEPTRYAACLIRLAGHDFMDYRNVNGTESGGSDGCINFEDEDNKGMDTCLTNSNLTTIYDKTCDTVSLADFIVIAAEAVTARTNTKYQAGLEFGNGTLEAKFRDNFRAGRTTKETCAETGLMPKAEAGCTDLKTIFVDNLYAGIRGNDRFKWKLAAAISGAHTIGKAQTANSGFNGTWSDSANQDVFNNNYYKSLLLKGWAPKKIDATHHQWERVDKSVGTDNEMMLSSDMCLAYLHNSEHDRCVDDLVAQGMNIGRANGRCRGLQKRGEPVNAANVHCCAWTNTRAFFNTGVLRRGTEAEYCGVNISQPIQFSEGRGHCCQGENARNTSEGDCDSSKWPKGKAFGAVLSFAQSEANWLRFYTKAWWLATEKGQTGLGPRARMGKGKGRGKKPRRRGGNKKRGGNKQGGNKSKGGNKQRGNMQQKNNKKQRGGRSSRGGNRRRGGRRGG